MSQVVHISLWQLGLGTIFILIAGATSLIYKLGLEKDLFWGAVRTFAQLFLMGYALTIIFTLNLGWMVLAIYAVMIGFAALTVRGRVKEKQVPILIPTFVSMLTSYMLVSILITGVIVGVDPWWQPRYFLTLGGMVVGNSMTAVAISLERLFAELRQRSNEVEMMLCLGADYKEASHPMLAEALKAGMIPSINSMIGAGIVFIPGMMTGQILAGADPLEAIRYQIVVMLMLVGSTALGSLLITLLVRRKCFGAAQELRLTKTKGLS
ncbi:ABC transporter permease [Desulfatibacillum aliphaticivorans]|uniref:ABC transporter permease n=1 Tax=Desulfatibacillum aliphaticivorans TaxID=218208 RepID=UPI00041FE31E|nr:iron export ABC transporter permease subunit FetB [Desulfatibacillum aliphaticivorans]